MTTEELELEKEWRANIIQQVRDLNAFQREIAADQAQTAVVLERVMGTIREIEQRLSESAHRDERRPIDRREWLMIGIMAAAVLVPVIEHVMHW
jgi:hypothetical protein